jgi:hypothetical protein
MIKTIAVAVALLGFAAAAQAQDICDTPSAKLSPNQLQACTDEHDAAVKRRQTAIDAQQQQVPGETVEETTHKLQQRQRVAGEVPIVSPVVEIPIR